MSVMFKSMASSQLQHESRESARASGTKNREIPRPAGAGLGMTVRARAVVEAGEEMGVDVGDFQGNGQLLVARC